MEHSEVNIVISGDRATVAIRYNGQQYTENWSRVNRGGDLHMDSNGEHVEIPNKLTQSVDPKFIARMMDTLNEY